jgi:hypothetical protein
MQAGAGEALKGAVAGAIGTVAMDMVTWPMYRREDERAYRREKQAQVGGKWVAHVAAEKLARKLGAQPGPQGLYAAGKAIHFLLGIGPGMTYALLRRRHPKIAAGGGLLFGLTVFLLNDELMAPAAGLASGPRRYPWQAHARGLLGHLMFGLATEQALYLLSKEAEKARRGW